MRRQRVPAGKVVAFRRGEVAPPEPAGEPGEFVETINAIAELWRSGRVPQDTEWEAPPRRPRRPSLRVVAGTGYETPTATGAAAPG